MVDHLSGPSFPVALLSGALAGLSVDLILFPLDTVKTRLQSSKGFYRSGAFRGMYSGIGSAAVGSMPGAALFFGTYETVKKLLVPHLSDSQQFTGHIIAASLGEPIACIVRVPTEVIKQRAQANSALSSYIVFRKTIGKEGFKGLYRGYFSTIMREVPFAVIQFPLWEYFKVKITNYQGHTVSAWQASLCGAVAGGFASAITTPLDVAKTRIMLAKSGTTLASGNIFQTLQVVWREKGIPGLFAGIVPRVLWISIGGAIFLGVYQKCTLLSKTVIHIQF